jgi:DNA repair photolyase
VRSTVHEEPCTTALAKVRGMPFAWSLNPYVGCAHRCAFCYVRAFELRAERPWDDRYGASVRAKSNIAAVLRRELARRSWKGEAVAIGTATDPYQPIEGRLRLTRGCLEQLAAAGNPFTLITRGPLAVRDIDVLVDASRHAEVQVSFSVPTLDDTVWRATEPATAPPRQRLRAVRRLADAGIDVGVALAPVLPGLSDRPELLAAVVRAARDAGARHLWVSPLNLRPGVREHFLDVLGRHWPEQRERYDQLYARSAYLPAAATAELRHEIGRLRALHPLADRLPPTPRRPRQEQLELAL